MSTKDYISKTVDEFGTKGILLVLVGSLVWSLTMVKSGLVYRYGMGFWGPNGHDGVWHIALAKSLSEGTWQMPVFASAEIQNYHIGFDLLLSTLHKLTFVPILNLYFQILPPLFAVLIGYFCYKFVSLWTKDKAKAYWSLFFLYFSGSFGWLVTYLRNRQIGGESMFWSQQSLSTLVNPPYALSLLLIFAGLYFLVQGERNEDKKLLGVATVLFGLLVQVKVYAGILMLGGLFLAAIWRMVQKKGVTLVRVFTGALVLSILIFSSTGSIQSTISYKPFWFLQTMMAFPDRVGWQRFANAIINYQAGGVWLKLTLAYLVAFVIFIIGNFGIRIVSIAWFVKKAKSFRNLTYLDVLITSVILAGIVLPMFFVQAGTAWNTIQFFYYTLVFSSILAGITFVDILRKLKLGKAANIAIEVVLILLIIPSSYATLIQYLPSRPPAMISNEELQALIFLSQQLDGIVLTIPFDKQKADAAVNNPPRPLYLYESTAYATAMTGKKVYLEDEVNLEITGYDWRKRRAEVETALRNQSGLENFMNSKDIKYFYASGENKNLYSSPGLEHIFENNEVTIYTP